MATGANQKGKKRGRYGEPVFATPEQEERYLANCKALAEKYYKASKLKDKDAKESAAWALARLDVYCDLLSERIAANAAPIEETGKLSALSKEMRALREEMGIVEVKIEGVAF